MKDCLKKKVLIHSIIYEEKGKVSEKTNDTMGNPKGITKRGFKITGFLVDKTYIINNHKKKKKLYNSKSTRSTQTK